MRSASKTARYMMLRQTRNEMRGENRNEMRGEGRRGENTRAEYGGGTRNEYGGTNNEYGGGMQNGGYETENRFRDRRGREHYDNGRYAPQNNYGAEMRGEGEIENRRGQRRGRNGRFRAEGNGGMRSAYDDDEEEYRMNTIGFGNRDYPEPVYQQGGARIDNGGSREMEQRSGKKEHGGAYSENMELTPEAAEKWTKSMQNGDKTTGPHWPMEKTTELARQRGLNVEPVEFYAVINAMYSDFYEVAKKHNVHNTDFYVDLAKAWLKDPDAVPNKAAMYYECVVKHDE